MRETSVYSFTESSQSKALLNSGLVNGLHYRPPLIWQIVPKRLTRLLWSVLRFGCAVKMEGRSCLGRIRMLSSQTHWGVLLDPLIQRETDGPFVENERTISYKRCIEDLRCRFPWASNIDLEICLHGFLAGEQFYVCNADRQEHETVEWVS
jgi:hypothetical protein